MTGHMPGPYWQITWRFVGPVLISVLLVASIIYRSFDKPAYYAWNAQEVGAGTAGWWAGAWLVFLIIYRRPWKEPIDRHPSYFLVYHLLIHIFFGWLSRARAFWHPTRSGCWSLAVCWPPCRSCPFRSCSCCVASNSYDSTRTSTKVSSGATRRPFPPSRWWPTSTWVVFLLNKI